MIVGGTMLFNKKSAISHHLATVSFMSQGQQASGDEAQAIAEADVAKMEQFMRTVAQQNAAEQEKVNQFMQHKSQAK